MRSVRAGKRLLALIAGFLLENLRDHSKCRSPYDVRADHQQIAPRRVICREMQNAGAGQQSQITSRPDKETATDTLTDGRQGKSFAHGTIHRAGRRAVSEMRNQRRGGFCLAAHVLFEPGFAREFHRNFTRRKGILFAMRQTPMPQNHCHRHRTGRDDARDRTNKRAEKSFFDW